MDEDARMFRIRNWWMVAQDFDEWKGFLEEAMTQMMMMIMMMMSVWDWFPLSIMKTLGSFRLLAIIPV